MFETQLQRPLEADSSARFFPWVTLLFLGSGAAALIYEIVWFQLLQLVIGSSSVSLAVLLGTFMGGMCLGSLLLPRLLSSRYRPLRVYALIEFGIAILALLDLYLVPYAGGFYTSLGGYGPRGIFFRSLLCGICLVPPTLLMGATLPVIARWIGATRRGVSWLGFFYAANIVGAVAGCVLAGFYLLRLYDMHAATYVAAVLNILVGAAALLIDHAAKPYDGIHDAPSTPTFSGPGSWAIYAALALSGAAALGAEVIWTRLLSLILGASVYSFSIVLAVFLAGLGLGSAAGSAISRRVTNAHRALAVCQILSAASIAWTAYMLAAVLPFSPIDTTIARNPWLIFQLDLITTGWAILPPACFWGASFPLGLAALVSIRPDYPDAGGLVGNLYAANTLGAIAGAIGFGLILAPSVGTQHAQQVLVAVAGTAALVAIFSEIRKSYALPAISGVLVVAALAAWIVPPTPSSLVAYGRFTARTLSQRDPSTGKLYVPNILYMGEGLNASVAVSETSTGHRNFHVSGKIEASTEPDDMRLQRMLGNLPALAHPNPRSVLVVGFGAGVTAGTFVNYPGIERIVICEIEPLIPQVVAEYFAEQNAHVLEDPRVEVVYDDARHYLLTTGEKFDIITSDPIHPWVKGAATLYTHEYLDLVRQHLNPGGVVSQWVPLYQSSGSVVKSEFATFFEVFPTSSVWSNYLNGNGYDVVLLARDSSNPLPNSFIDVNEVSTKLGREDHAKVLKSLNEVGFSSATDLFGTYTAQSQYLHDWLIDAEINRDRNLRLQYLAGMTLNRDEGASIQNDLQRFFRVPEGLLAEPGRPGRLDAFRAEAIAKALAADPPRHVSIASRSGDAEAFENAMILREAITVGGWRVNWVDSSVFSDLVIGMMVSVGADPPPPAANELVRALRGASLAAPVYRDPRAAADSVLLFVGEKQ